MASRLIICQRLSQIIDLLDTGKSRYSSTTEFNNCFIIRSPSLFLRSTEENAFYSCTVHEVVTVLYAMWTPSWTGWHISIPCVQFFSPGNWYLFCDTRSQMKHWRFSVCDIVKIVGYVDNMLTMYSAHCICFYGF